MARWTCAALVAAGLLGAAPGAGAFAVDGKLAAGEGYTTGFEVDFSVDGKPVVTGGFVAFGQDAMGQYLYFAEPKGFVDNSYGANLVGWGATSHPFDKLLGSDKAAFAFQTTNGLLDVKVDYLARTSKNTTNPDDYHTGAIGKTDGPGTAMQDKNDGSVVSGSQAAIDSLQAAATSLEYNIQTFKNNSAGLDVLTDSPETVGSRDNTGTSTEADYAVTDPAFSGWIFEVGYELKFAPGTFDADAWANPVAPTSADAPSGALGNQVFGRTAAGDVIALFDLTTGHASPSKLGQNTPDDISIKECPPGSTNPVCNVGGGGGGTTTVPEPGTLALALAGLAVPLTSRLRRRRQR